MTPAHTKGQLSIWNEILTPRGGEAESKAKKQGGIILKGVRRHCSRRKRMRSYNSHRVREQSPTRSVPPHFFSVPPPSSAPGFTDRSPHQPPRQRGNSFLILICLQVHPPPPARRPRAGPEVGGMSWGTFKPLLAEAVIRRPRTGALVFIWSPGNNTHLAEYAVQLTCQSPPPNGPDGWIIWVSRANGREREQTSFKSRIFLGPYSG